MGNILRKRGRIKKIEDVKGKIKRGCKRKKKGSVNGKRKTRL